MRLVLQRVTGASVKVDGRVTGSIGLGLTALVGISRNDTREDAEYCAGKLLGLRVFADAEGKMNLGVAEAGGAILVISQFTLYGDCSRGRRPSFDEAAPPAAALDLYNYFLEALRRGPVPIETGVFQADMEVSLVNQGPVTLLIDSAARKKK